MKITITEEKKEKLGKCAEKILRYSGKLMSCIETLGEDDDDDDDEYGERNSMMGMREDDEEMPRKYYGERRARYRRY